MWKKILTLSVSLCLFTAGVAYGAAAPSSSGKINNRVKPAPSSKIKYIRLAKLYSVELNYNDISVALSRIHFYKTALKGKEFTLIVRSVLTTGLKQGEKISLPTINSADFKKAYYYVKNYTLFIHAVLKKRITKNQIVCRAEGHLITCEFPTLKNIPAAHISFPKTKSQNGSGYTVKNGKTVYISLKNITMIIAPARINKIIFSKDQNIEISKSGNEAFIKILPLEEQKPDGRIKFLYNVSARDVYVLTPIGTYVLNLVPRRIPSLIITLKKPQIPIKAEQAKTFNFNPAQFNPGISRTISNYQSGAYTSSLSNIIKDAYRYKIPTGYEVLGLKKIYRFRQITLKGTSAWVGKRFIVLIYSIKALVPVKLNEKEFLWITPNPLAVSLTKLAMSKGQDGRLFIVEAN